MKELERKQFKASLKAVSEPEGIIEAIVSVFNNEDLGGDIVREGAFTESLATKMPKGVWMHDWSQPVAKTLLAKECAPGDPMLPPSLANLGGLYIKGQFNLNTQRGREAFSDIQFGIVDEFSIGYYASKVLYDTDDYSRELIECELVEWSPVLQGMNPATALISAKSADGDAASDATPLSQDLETWIAHGERVAKRLQARGDLLTKQGRVFSQANLEQMQAAVDILVNLISKAIDASEEEEESGDEGKSAHDAQAPTLKYEDAALRLKSMEHWHTLYGDLITR